MRRGRSGCDSSSSGSSSAASCRVGSSVVAAASAAQRHRRRERQPQRASFNDSSSGGTSSHASRELRSSGPQLVEALGAAPSRSGAVGGSGACISHAPAELARQGVTVLKQAVPRSECEALRRSALRETFNDIVDVKKGMRATALNATAAPRVVQLLTRVRSPSPSPSPSPIKPR